MNALNLSETVVEMVDPVVAGQLLDRAREAKAAAAGAIPDEHDSEAARLAVLSDVSRLAATLQRIEPRDQLADRPVALAFWINVYNALVIHGALQAGVRRSLKEVPGFFRRTAYRIGGRVFGLNDIEHGILRQNRGHPARGLLPQWMPWDDRCALVIRPMDTRIHFALNCGAASCPPIRHYAAAEIDAQLELAARAFMAGGGVRIDAETGQVRLSRIFLWFWRDFGRGRRRQLRFALRYVDADARTSIEAAACRQGIAYDAYDWRFG
ncbi:MAG: DUF547 domain-containing protein [Phycisphaerae bacterium]